MKTIYIALALWVISCGNSLGDDQNNNIALKPADIDVLTGGKGFSFAIDRFTLRLSYKDGKCLLEYHSVNDEQWRKHDMGMEAPCDFIGRKIKTNPPQRYVFGQVPNRVTILIVTGGPPHPTFKDEFMPNGCGSRLGKVRVYSDRVEVEQATEPDRSSTSQLDSYCPSNPLDEVFFATG